MTADLTNEPVSGLVERVRRYLINSLPAQPVQGFPAADANDALAELERRLERVEGERDFYADRGDFLVYRREWDALNARAETAEALVGELREAQRTNNGSAIRLESENKQLREALQACYDDLLRYAPAHWRNQGRGEQLAWHALALAKTERDGERGRA